MNKMTACSVVALSAFLLIGTAGSVFAFETAWDHSGSLVKMIRDGRQVRIVFLHPKPSARRKGIERGTLLFFGSLDSDEELGGTAYAYRAGCEPVAFPVHGLFEPGSGREHLMLEGSAPDPANGSCSANTSGGARRDTQLVFDLVGIDGRTVNDGQAGLVDHDDEEPQIDVAAREPSASGEQPVELRPTLDAGDSGLGLPRDGLTLGGVVREAPDQESSEVASLSGGEPITIISDSGAAFDGYTWYQVRYQGGKGYLWGGAMCVKGTPLAGARDVCP